MLHPFAGVIAAGQTSTAAADQPSTTATRRTALGIIAGAAATAAVSSSAGLVRGDEPVSPPRIDPKAATGYALYLVEPRQLKQFSEAKRQALGVNGPFKGRWPENHPMQDRRGYLAWLSPAQSVKLTATPGIAGVRRITAADVVEHGQRKPGQNVMNVFISPNGWRIRPASNTYLPVAKLVQQWDAIGNATFSSHPQTKTIKVHFRKGVEQKLIDAIRGSGQVHAISWDTLAAGDDDDNPITTQALGEEGGPTTKRLGEEGGATTKRLGEEGGPTTLAVGEEGGPKPSTRALGEEGGGKITTFALGEEGGPRR